MKSANNVGFVNSPAVGMAVARPYGFEINFVRNPMSGSAVWCFVIILEFIFKPIFAIKIHEKNSLTPKNFIRKHSGRKTFSTNMNIFRRESKAAGIIDGLSAENETTNNL